MLLLVEPLAPGLFIIKTLLDPAPRLGTHAKNQLSTDVWAFSAQFCSFNLCVHLWSVPQF